MSFSEWLQRRLGLHGLRLDTKSAWEVASPNNPALFLRSLPILFDPPAVLYVEGQTAPEVRSFLERRPADRTLNIARATIWPRPQIYHMPLTVHNMKGLASLAERHEAWEIADYIHVYQGRRILLEWYGALVEDPFLVSKCVPPDRLQRFCELLGVHYRDFSITEDEKA